jgi:hypothetical protein
MPARIAPSRRGVGNRGRRPPPPLKSRPHLKTSEGLGRNKMMVVGSNGTRNEDTLARTRNNLTYRPKLFANFFI